tara:strand:+ start:87 stop:287 length:201 start_codon:yes stop_codon:yes gene_type:complete
LNISDFIENGLTYSVFGYPPPSSFSENVGSKRKMKESKKTLIYFDFFSPFISGVYERALPQYSGSL